MAAAAAVAPLAERALELLPAAPKPICSFADFVAANNRVWALSRCRQGILNENTQQYYVLTDFFGPRRA